MATPLGFNDLAHELHLSTYAYLLLCNNVPIRCRHGSPTWQYIYDFDLRSPNLDYRHRLTWESVQDQNRFVHLTVEAAQAFHPYIYVPIVTDNALRIAFHGVGRPTGIVAKVHIVVPTVPAPQRHRSDCLLPINMLRSFLSRLGSLYAASPPRRLLTDPSLLSDVWDPDMIRSDIIVDIHKHPDPNFQAISVRLLLDAFAELQSDAIRMWSNGEDPVVPTSQLEQAVQPNRRSLELWAVQTISQHRAAVVSSTKLVLQRGLAALDLGSGSHYALPAIAHAAQSMFWVILVSSENSIEQGHYIQMFRQLVVATCNAIAIARRPGAGRDGWEGLIQGECGSPLCLCTLLGELQPDDTSTPAQLALWRALKSDVGLPAWRMMRHLIVLVHYLSDDVYSTDDVDDIRHCIRELKQINSTCTRRERQGDQYISYDISILEDLVTEIDSWRAEHPDVEVKEFQPRSLEGEEVNFVDTNLIMWCRLSVGGGVEGLPVRLLEINGTELRIRSVAQGGLDVLVETDFL